MSDLEAGKDTEASNSCAGLPTCCCWITRTASGMDYGMSDSARVRRADDKYYGLEESRRKVRARLKDRKGVVIFVKRSHGKEQEYHGRSVAVPASLQVEITDKVIGKGQYGVVWEGLMLAADYMTGGKPRKVAVKQMESSRLEQTGTEYVKNETGALQKELQVFESIRLHENVVRFYGGWIEDNGQVSIIEELMHGNLNRLVHDSSKMAQCTYSQLLKIFSDVVAGVLHLHSAGIIHHDLKPANVLLDDTHTLAKISDFGCSKFKPKDYLTAELVGTMGYLPLECLFAFLKLHVRGEKIDVFSMGVVMWESITGRKPPNPFAADYTLGHISEDSLQPSVSSWQSISDADRYPMGPDIPSDLSALVWKCLSIHADKRPTMAFVRDCLGELQRKKWIGRIVRPLP